MLRGSSVVGASLLCLCAACAGIRSGAEPPTVPDNPPDSGAPAEAAPPRDDGLLPPVFTAEQIRAASPAGRVYVWRFEAGEDVSIQRLRFVRVDAEGALLRSYADGREGPDDRVSWADLEAHGRYPAATTTRVRERIEVPHGSFDGWHYTTTSPDQRMEVWFADALPGAPIRQRIKKGGRVVFFMELLDHAVEPINASAP